VGVLKFISKELRVSEVWMGQWFDFDFNNKINGISNESLVFYYQTQNLTGKTSNNNELHRILGSLF